MDLSPFKQDIDELIDEFVQGESTKFVDMKRVWLSRKFSYIFEASPSTNLAFFMQSLYAHSIGHMLNTASFSRRLGGLYCLYCLYETQPFKPPFKIYLSLWELKKLKNLVTEAKGRDIRVVTTMVKQMLDKNVFLFGFVDSNKGSATETVNHLTQLQNARVHVAYEKLFNNSQIEKYLHMDLGMEVDVDLLKEMSAKYAESKKQAIEEASGVVDVQNIKHISDGKELLGNMVDKIASNWNAQKETFYKQTSQHPAEKEQQRHLLCLDHSQDHQLTEVDQHLAEQQPLQQNEEDNNGFDEFYRLLLEYN